MSRKRPNLVVLYDDQCPLCAQQMRLIRRLDWFGAIAPMPLSHPEASALAAGIEREQLLEALHCIAPGGKVHRGARAIRRIAMRMPLTAPLALILWIPGMIFAAEWIYRRVSQSRHRLSRLVGCDDACVRPPGRER